jgi:hypothetical protein
MQHRINKLNGNLFPRQPNTLVTLTLSYPLVTFQLSLISRQLYREGAACVSFAEVT